MKRAREPFEFYKGISQSLDIDIVLIDALEKAADKLTAFIPPETIAPKMSQSGDSLTGRNGN